MKIVSGNSSRSTCGGNVLRHPQLGALLERLQAYPTLNLINPAVHAHNSRRINELLFVHTGHFVAHELHQSGGHRTSSSRTVARDAKQR
jgi:hypothetical protein